MDFINISQDLFNKGFFSDTKDYQTFVQKTETFKTVKDFVSELSKYIKKNITLMDNEKLLCTVKSNTNVSWINISVNKDDNWRILDIDGLDSGTKTEKQRKSRKKKILSKEYISQSSCSDTSPERSRSPVKSIFSPKRKESPLKVTRKHFSETQKTY